MLAARSFGDVVGDAENGTAELLCPTKAFASSVADSNSGIMIVALRCQMSKS